MSGSFIPDRDGLKLYINKLIYTGFKTVDVKSSIEDLSGSFMLTMSGNFDDATPFIKPLSSCVLALNGEVVITGFVDRVVPTYKKNDHQVTIIGRDKAADLIDCSVISKSGQYLKLKLEEIVTQICEPFNIKVTVDNGIDTGDIIPVFAIEQGMTAFEAIQKCCKIRRCLATSDGNGGLLITRSGTKQVKTVIAEGVNILEASAEYDFSNRFSQYICKGQQAGDNTTAIGSITANVGQVSDPGVNRYRPTLIIAEGQATTKDCEDRAQWEQAVRLGKSQKFTVTVNGWDDPITNTLWQVNQLVTFKAPTLGIFDNLLIMSVNFKLSEGGQLTILELTPASAYLTFEVNTSAQASNAYLQG